MSFATIATEGNLIPADLLERIASGEAEGQQPADFGFERARRLTDEIAAAWSDARAYWDSFGRRLKRLRDDDPATSLTREFWVVPLLEILGYSLTYMPSAAVVDARTYAISHRAGADESAPPVHIEGVRRSLDQRAPRGGPRLSPHALLQEYLNATEHLWGIVTNGERLRLLRDSSRTTRPTYVEFDLRAMLEGEKFSEFALLYRLIHRSRLPQAMDDAPRCLLERYHQQAIEAGGRVRDGLRDGVELALRTLGNGLIQHPANAALREQFSSGRLSDADYYRELLRLVYRLLFLMVAEERNLIGLKAESEGLKENEERTPTPQPSALSPQPSGLAIYRQYYSVTRLRRLAERSMAGQSHYDDLWLGLLATFRLFEDDAGAEALGLAALDGDLFGPGAIPSLQRCALRNDALLRAIRALSLYRDPQSKALRRVNYSALDVEELGSVYESLLDYRPVVAQGTRDWGSGIGENGKRAIAVLPGSQSPVPSSQFPSFDLVTGTDRKTTGSYYTRPELVHELIKSALEPVIEERLKATQEPRTKNQEPTSGSRFSILGSQPQEEALLSITVCDPACGSGHFLLAAARRLGRELARVRSGEDQPSPEHFRRAVRDVIARCIYGVDANPLAVDLCKLALWIEGFNAGMPLSFLDSHIRWGNSLVGARRDLVDAGIPDDAFKPVTGDDKTAASALRKRNKKEREAFERGQLGLALNFDDETRRDAMLAEARRVDAAPDTSVASVRAKADAYARLRGRGSAWYDEWTRFNLWTAAFFTPLVDANDPTVPTIQSLLDFEASPASAHGQMVGRANALALEMGFFHWELEFPQVFATTKDEGRTTKEMSDLRPSSSVLQPSSGFDVVLGNPPWEMINLMEQEHFVDVPEIAGAANKAAREKMIAAWRSGSERQRSRIAAFDAAKYRAEAESRFISESGRFPLTAVGRLNTYSLFAEHSRTVIALSGCVGIIVPTGIATDDNTKTFFADLNTRRELVSLYDFENRDAIFPGVHRSYKFCTITIGTTNKATRFIFFATNTNQLNDEQRTFTLTAEEITLLNPNTRTASVFRTQADAELTKKVYRRVPVLVNERSEENPWRVTFRQGLFNMTSDSGLFHNEQGNEFLPLYEGNMVYIYDHRYATFSKQVNDYASNEQKETVVEVVTKYFVPATEVERRLSRRNWSRKWFYGIRRVARSTDARTIIGAFVPYQGISYGLYLVFTDCDIAQYICLTAVFNSLVLDYLCRTKLSQPSLTQGLLDQLPVLPPSAFSAADIAFIVPRVLELVYTAWDIKAFAEDVWNELGDKEQGIGDRESLRGEILRRNAVCNADADPALFPPTPGIGADGALQPSALSPQPFALPPFKWNDERRALIRAELDARIARLYGLTRDELRYILDPADVYGPDFPGETFRVLKEKETKQFGEYRTRRLVLEAWDREEQ